MAGFVKQLELRWDEHDVAETGQVPHARGLHQVSDSQRHVHNKAHHPEILVGKRVEPVPFPAIAVKVDLESERLLHQIGKWEQGVVGLTRDDAGKGKQMLLEVE